MKADSETSTSRSPESTSPGADGRNPADPAPIDAVGQDCRREGGKVQAHRHERAEEQGLRHAGRGVEGGKVRLLRLGRGSHPRVSDLLQGRTREDGPRPERAHEEEEGLAGPGPLPARALGERPADNRERTDRQEEPDQVEQPAAGPESALRNDADRLVGVAAPVGLEHGCD